MNKMNHMSMVANAYDTNQNLSQYEIVDLLATRFSRTLRNWWDKHLTEDFKEEIRKAVMKNEDGLPTFDGKLGRGEPDCVNTLIYTIMKHFVGTPFNIISRIYDYRWYQDVFIFRVLVRFDCQKPY
jgi:hypothetical protein